MYEVCSTINFPGSRVSDFSGNSSAKKLNKSQTKRVNITCVQYFCGIVLLTRVSTGVMSNLSYHLSYIHYTSSRFAPTSIFASASATDRVRSHQQSTPPPTTEYAVPLVRAGMRKHKTASPPDRQTRPI